ncbi:hypothetical protein, partial [Streptomyces sp. NPDC060333]|uniref:hypothetical protein n=1 Tax=Streptomyces sp. NPDC060333 TaxID=3347098 RepID=UPI003659280B
MPTASLGLDGVGTDQRGSVSRRRTARMASGYRSGPQGRSALPTCGHALPACGHDEKRGAPTTGKATIAKCDKEKKKKIKKKKKEKEKKKK